MTTPTDTLPAPSRLIVLDTNVCLDLFVFHDPRWATLLSGLKDGSIKAVTRSDCRAEWLAVLHYPHLPIADDQRDGIAQQFDLHIECIAPTAKSTLRLPVCSDKDDQKFLELARDAGAAILVTKDKALLKLARKTKQAGLYTIQTPEKFVAEYPA
ncbi:putative toxin-antitoxin system toxin component, PIN family [Undibacterium sp. TJN25]|uniref:putative toxin-antitoxin system toxin component, PIN family n=1 Tax=Undibacterium sp. TJN25 TaxID=3413056 RepID=UPI003BF3FB0D